ncbi:hypothetical protein JA1_001916 [Spathaspora sp. JA1]|nr:hypothetical protein JA1_001916 [Spathaspora sp. JA1]
MTYQYQVDVDPDPTFQYEEEYVEEKYLCVVYRMTGVYLSFLKQVISEFYDIVATYSTLLKKIQALADINELAVTTRLSMYTLEVEFNYVMSEKNFKKWDEPESDYVQEMNILLLDAAIEAFTLVVKTINSVELLFDNFSNLKGLIVPEALNKSKEVLDSLVRVKDLVNLVMVDSKLGSLKQGYCTEKVLLVIKEKRVLRDSFTVLEGSMIRYFLRVFAKNFITEETVVNDCILRERRRLVQTVGFQSITIPFTNDEEDQENQNKFKNTGMIFLVAFGLLLSFACLRLYDLIFSK